MRCLSLWICEVGKLLCITYVVICDTEASQRSEVGSRTEFLSDILGERADVSATRYMAADDQLWVGIFQNLDAMNRNRARGVSNSRPARASL